jgi:hypothetical protein
MVWMIHGTNPGRVLEASQLNLVSKKQYHGVNMSLLNAAGSPNHPKSLTSCNDLVKIINAL